MKIPNDAVISNKMVLFARLLYFIVTSSSVETYSENEIMKLLNKFIVVHLSDMKGFEGSSL